MMKKLLSHFRRIGRCKLDGESTRLSRLRNLEWKKWLLVCLLGLAEVLATSSYTMITPFFPVEAEEQGSGAFMTGVILSATSLSLMVCSSFFGYILPKVGIKFTLISGTLLIGVGNFVMRFLVNLPAGWVFITSAILMRLVEGVGWAMYQTSVYTLLAQLFPDHVGTAIGFVEVATSMGYALGPFIGGALYGIGGFTLPFTAVGAFIVLLAIPLMILIKPTSVSPQPLPLKALLILLSDLSFVALIIGNVIVVIAMTYYDPTLQPFLLKEFGLNPLKIGLLWLPFIILDAPLALAVGRLSDKFGPRIFIISGLFIGGIVQFFIGPADFISKPQLWIVFTAILIADIGQISVYVPVYSDLLELALFLLPNEEETGLISMVSGVVVFSTSLGEVLGPIIGGGLVEISDFPTSSVVIGELLIAQGFLLLGVTMIDRLFKPKEEKPSSNHCEIRNSH